MMAVEVSADNAAARYCGKDRDAIEESYLVERAETSEMKSDRARSAPGQGQANLGLDLSTHGINVVVSSVAPGCVRSETPRSMFVEKVYLAISPYTFKACE